MNAFLTSGLDVLGVLEQSLNENRRNEIIDWIYGLQTQSGFLGSTFLKSQQNVDQSFCDTVHVAMTYTALATLVILGKMILWGLHKKWGLYSRVHCVRKIQVSNLSLRTSHFKN